jgi:hypothetical protein
VLKVPEGGVHLLASDLRQRERGYTWGGRKVQRCSYAARRAAQHVGTAALVKNGCTHTRARDLQGLAKSLARGEGKEMPVTNRGNILFTRGKDGAS